MEKQPEVLLLSLQEMALRSTVVHFWSAADVRYLIEKFPFKKGRHDKWKIWEKTVEKKVEEKISGIVIPKVLKRRMSLIVKPIGLQIPEWMNFMEQCLCDSVREESLLDVCLLNHLCWTSAGAIHYKRTAEKLVSLQTLDVVKRFQIACEHCLVDYLPVIWQNLPEELKREFFEPFFSPTETDCRLYEECLMQVYWAYVLKGEEYKLLESRADFYSHALKFSVKRGNKAATEYFFQKLSNEERVSFLSSTDFHYLLWSRDVWRRETFEFPEEKCTDAVCYLLSQITPQKHTLLTYAKCAGHLFAFLTWRWQDFFLEKTDLIWEFLHEHRITHYSVLSMIRRKVHFSDYYFPELLQEFIRRSPKSFKKYLANEEILHTGPYPLFTQLLSKKDKETVRVILRNIDVQDRFQLVSSEAVFRKFNCLLDRKLHHLVELCVREACQSKKDRKRLKQIFMGFMNSDVEVFEWGLKWQHFFDALDKLEDIFLKKRSLEDKTETRARKLQREKE